MLNVILFAGSNTAKLAEFFKQRGTFDIQFYGNNLVDNYSELSKQIIKCDKLIYIFREDSMNIREDMHSLQSLISGSGFFKPKEYIFLSEDNDISNNAKKYFLSVMADCGIDAYTMSILDKGATFANIYSSLIGTSTSVNFENTYRPLYKRERNSKATVQYEAVYDEDLIIEAVDYSSVDQYKKSKAITDRLDGGDILSDAEFWEFPDRFMDVNIGALEIKNSQRHIMCIIGEQNVGKAVWTAAIAQTAIDDGWETQVYDFSRSKSVKDKLNLDLKQPIDVIRADAEGSFICEADSDLLNQAIININPGKHLGILLFEEEDFNPELISVMSPICVWVTNQTDKDIKKIKIRSEKDVIILTKTDKEKQEEMKRMFGCKVVQHYNFKTVSDIPRLFYRLTR